MLFTVLALLLTTISAEAKECTAAQAAAKECEFNLHRFRGKVHSFDRTHGMFGSNKITKFTLSGDSTLSLECREKKKIPRYRKSEDRMELTWTLSTTRGIADRGVNHYANPAECHTDLSGLRLVVEGNSLIYGEIDAKGLRLATDPGMRLLEGSKASHLLLQDDEKGPNPGLKMKSGGIKTIGGSHGEEMAQDSDATKAD